VGRIVNGLLNLSKLLWHEGKTAVSAHDLGLTHLCIYFDY
jgi:hypothetical protein